jgi:FkbH-like protein
MKLIEALQIAGRPVIDSAAKLKVFLACGFTPLHLQTFLTAHLRAQSADTQIELKTGLFGDLAGSIERMEPAQTDLLAIVVEWSDFDPRLGIRMLGGWRPADLPGIVESAELASNRLERAIKAVAGGIPETVVCMPTLPLPSMFATRPVQAGAFEMELHHMASALARCLSREPGVRVVNPQWLSEMSPLAARYDVKSDVTAGFPYTLRHASSLGQAFASSAQIRRPMKGLITDLDDTLWAGIVGEDGVDGISWDLDHNSQMHGVYQQFVASLADYGILVGVASKNEASTVARAFQRKDLLLSESDIYPFETHWSLKSESVKRILKIWNVSPDSVVFIDDSPMEIAEVKSIFPEMECRVFPRDNFNGVLELMKDLRGLFGKMRTTEEDSIRLRSIREAGAWRDVSVSSQGASEEFLKSVDACVVIDSCATKEDRRALELINKTNQFNLNGKRLSESEWRDLFVHSERICLTVSYNDKFGPLGKIAVILGKKEGKTVTLTHWVMSCRAFSRSIEHQCLKYLFESLEADEIRFEFQPTPRNGPIRDFLAWLLASPLEPGVRLTRSRFEAMVPLLFHRVEVTSSV